MIHFRSSALLLTLSSFLNSMAAAAHAIKWEKELAKLPTPLSDMSATYDEGTSNIYLIGGCDDPQGNSQLAPDLFVCLSITAKGHAFDPSTGKFESLPEAPRPRYRHSATNVHGRIWLIGGRTLDDTVIPEIDVYDTMTKSWSTIGSLPSDFQFSDHGSFYHQNYTYVVGGYMQSYAANDVTFRLSTEINEEEGLVTELMAPLADARGDVHAVIIDDYAYITGGYTHSDTKGGWCIPHSSTERYDLLANEWTTIDDLATGRADKALVALDGTIFAFGGETKDTAMCSGDTAEYTMALSDVEILEQPHLDSSTWHPAGESPSRVFRFSGAAYPPTDSIYTFGGQEFYSPTCECFATSDEITKYVDHDVEESGDDGSDSNTEESGAASRPFSIVAIAVTAVTAFALYH